LNIQNKKIEKYMSYHKFILIMFIKIMTLNGNIYNYEVENTDSISSLKKKFIESINDYTMNSQYFHYKKESLKDETKTFKDYNIFNDEVLLIGVPNLNYNIK